MKTPRLTDAHVGPRAWQSAHRLLSSCLSNSARTRFCSSFCALLTAFLLLLMMELWLRALRLREVPQLFDRTANTNTNFGSNFDRCPTGDETEAVQL